MRTRTIVAAMILFSLMASASPAALIYLSDKGPGQGTTPGNLNLSVGLNDTFTLYLWADLVTGENVSALAVDILPSNPNVLGAIAATVENPPLFADYWRWNVTGVAPNADSGDAYRFAGWAYGADPVPDPGVPSVTGYGLRPLTSFDPTYEAGAGWLLGSITYTAKMARTVNLTLRVGDFTMLSPTPVFFGTGDAAVSHTVPRATSTVAEAVITVDGGPGPFPLADGNHDTLVNALDIGPFITAVTSGGADQADTADVNRDGAVNALDINFFVTLVIGGTLPGPQPQPLLKGDCNLDGFTNAQDIAPFIAALIGGGYVPYADIDDDGVITPADLQAFIDLLTDIMLGGTPPTYGLGGGMAIPEPSVATLVLAAGLAMTRRRWPAVPAKKVLTDG